jgi:putative peptide zinc metalloprotease protein
MAIALAQPSSDQLSEGDLLDPDVPQLAEGIELLGEYEGSGFRETPYLVQRADGQVLRLTHLLYLVAAYTDGRRDFGQIADRVSTEFGRSVSADNVRFLVEKKLRPLGVLVAADGSSPKLKRPDPLLGLKFRTTLVPEGVVDIIAGVLRPLFLPAVIAAMLLGLIAFDVWFFFIHGVGQGVHEVFYQPALLLMVLGLTVLSVAFHECGHAAACRYGGAKPGAIGAGIYVIWPALYTDVTDAYRLGRAGRLRTDLGGVYFNAIFSLAAAGAYFLTGFEPLLLVILLQHLDVVRQFMPFLRLDGYYVVSDLVGVPDLFGYIKPILKSLVPTKKTSARVKELKPWVRAVVSAWVLAAIPILLYLFGMMVIVAPRVFATGWDSLLIYHEKASNAFANGEAITGIIDSLQMALLVLPATGIALMFLRVGRRLGAAAWSWSEGNAAARAGLISTTAAAVSFALFIWWPNGDYQPIQPGETATVQDSITTLSKVYTGRPALTVEHERELGGVPMLNEHYGYIAGPGSTVPPREASEPITTEPNPTPAADSSTTEATHEPVEASSDGEIVGVPSTDERSSQTTTPKVLKDADTAPSMGTSMPTKSQPSSTASTTERDASTAVNRSDNETTTRPVTEPTNTEPGSTIIEEPTPQETTNPTPSSG